MSPIPSLRKGNYNATLDSIGTETMNLGKFPPSFRITRNYGTGRSQLRHRTQRGKYIISHLIYLLLLINLLFINLQESPPDPA